MPALCATMAGAGASRVRCAVGSAVCLIRTCFTFAPLAAAGGASPACTSRTPAFPLRLAMRRRWRGRRRCLLCVWVRRLALSVRGRRARPGCKGPHQRQDTLRCPLCMPATPETSPGSTKGLGKNCTACPVVLHMQGHPHAAPASQPCCGVLRPAAVLNRALQQGTRIMIVSCLSAQRYRSCAVAKRSRARAS